MSTEKRMVFCAYHTDVWCAWNITRISLSNQAEK